METRKDVLVEFLRALLHIPQLLRRLAFKTRTLEQELHAVRQCKDQPGLQTVWRGSLLITPPPF